MRKITIICLSFILLSSIIFLIPTDNQLKAQEINDITYEIHEPIKIDSDADFISANGITGGSGTSSEPWIIDGYEINGTTSGYGIFIENTDDYFIIQNCKIYDTRIEQKPRGYNSGISIFNASNGLVQNNQIYDNMYGIQLYKATSNTIKENEIIDNGKGIGLYYSFNFNNITSNHIKECYYGIGVGSTGIFTIENNIISNSTNIAIAIGANWNGEGSSGKILNNQITNCSEGIKLTQSQDIIIDGNVLGNCGIRISGDESQYWDSHIINTTNRVNGKPIIYWTQQSGGTIPPGAGQIILASCNDVMIENQNLNNVSMGIQLGFSSSNTISECNISDYEQTGIYLYLSNHNTIENSNILFYLDEIGIHLEASSNNHVLNNFIWGLGTGVYLHQSTNTEVSQNEMKQCSISINGRDLAHWNTHIIEYNTAMGRPIYYWADKDSGTIPGDAGQVILANCQNIIVSNLHTYNNEAGILVGKSTNITITNIFASFYNFGVSIYDSDYCYITDSYIHNCDNGIYLLLSDHITIKNNSIGSCDNGINLISSGNCNISHNNITESTNGININECYHNMISYNKVSNNSAGIALEACMDNQIEWNEFNDNNRGIDLHGKGISITNNTFSRNQDGIYINGNSGYSVISNNTFIDNEVDINKLNDSESSSPIDSLFIFIILLWIVTVSLILIYRRRSIKK